MALPTFATLPFAQGNTVASFNVDVTSLGLAEGDALIVLTAEDTNPDGHTVTGNNNGAYTLLHESSSSSPSSTVAWKVQGATPDTSVTVDLIATRATGTTGLMIKVPGVDVANPLDATLTRVQGSSGMPNPPALTTVTAGAVRIITGHLDDDVTPVTAPAGFEQVVYNGVANPDGGNATVMIAFREEATPGSLTPPAFVSSDGSGDDEWWATHFAVNLAPAGGEVAEVSGNSLSLAPAVQSGEVTPTASATGGDLTVAPQVASGQVTPVEAAAVSGNSLAAAPVVQTGAVTTEQTIGAEDLVVPPATGAGTITAEAVATGAPISAQAVVDAGQVTQQGAAAVTGQPVTSEATTGAAAVTAHAAAQGQGVATAPTAGAGTVTATGANPSAARVTSVTAVGRVTPAVTSQGRPAVVAITATR